MVEKERKIKGYWDGAAVDGKVLTYHARYGVGTKGRGGKNMVFGEQHLHGL